MQCTDVIIVVLFVCGYFSSFSEASMCEPNSLFHVDCNLCHCTEDGKGYSCDSVECPRENRYDNFYTEINREGRMILRPKPKSSTKYKPNDKDYILPGKINIATLLGRKNWDSDENSIENSNRGSPNKNQNFNIHLFQDYQRKTRMDNTRGREAADEKINHLPDKEIFVLDR